MEVDLGAGFGAFAVALAAQYPDRNVLAVEREGDRVDLICRKTAVAGVQNLKVLHLEAAYTVEYLLPPGTVSVVHLLFPDPWPKRAHHKRRIVTEGFLHSIWKALAPGGEFRFATDSADYMAWTQERLQPAFKRGDWELADYPQPPARPQTDFEKLWTEHGRDLNYLALRKLVPKVES